MRLLQESLANIAKINYNRFRLRRRRHVILVIAIVIDQGYRSRLRHHRGDSEDL